MVINVKIEEGQAQSTNGIPGKVQRIGTPGKTTALYIEDYVYTFMKQLMLLEQEADIDIYGYVVKHQKRNQVVVTAAREQNGTQEAYEQDSEIFEQLERIGNIHIDAGRRSIQNGILQLALDQENRQNVNGFYIFYEKNEPMQNYLVNWHKGNHKDKETPEMTVKYAKKLQETRYSHARESYWKQSITAIAGTLFVILSVMAITVINNYQKMLDLQDHISYIVTCMADDHNQVETILHQNADVINRLFQDESKWTTNTEEPQIQSTIQEETSEEETLEQQETLSQEEGTTSEEQEIKMEEESSTAKEQRLKSDEEGNSEEEKSTKSTSEQIENIVEPKAEQVENELVSNQLDNEADQQVYLVTEGDTLQSILYQHYGTLKDIDRICELNQITNPDEIRIGQKLYLP